MSVIEVLIPGWRHALKELRDSSEPRVLFSDKLDEETLGSLKHEISSWPEESVARRTIERAKPGDVFDQVDIEWIVAAFDGEHQYPDWDGLEQIQLSTIQDLEIRLAEEREHLEKIRQRALP